MPGELPEKKRFARAEVAMHEHERRVAGIADGRDDGRERGIGMKRDAAGRYLVIVGAVMLLGKDGEVLIDVEVRGINGAGVQYGGLGSDIIVEITDALEIVEGQRADRRSGE